MSRIILYQSLALVSALTAGVQNAGQAGSWQPHNPVVFAKPFPTVAQQYVAMPWQGNIPTVPTPHGWEGQQLEVKFAKPYPAALQQFSAHVPEHVPQQLDTEGVFFQSPDVFKKPLSPVAQQFAAFQPQGFIQSTFPDGWRGVQLIDYAFKKPYPAAAQQYSAFQPQGFIASTTPHGWEGQQLEYRFAKPYPASLQQYSAHGPEHVPVPLDIEGWIGFEFDYAFVKPFPVASQQFGAWTAQVVPQYFPPGGGKRYKKPTDYLPEPPYEAKKNPPFRPVWDKPKQGEIEQPKQAAPSGPPPLPPPSLFGPPSQGQRSSTPLNLPDFKNLVPQDPLGLTKRMRDAQDRSDAIAILRSLGLIQDEGQ